VFLPVRRVRDFGYQSTSTQLVFDVAIPKPDPALCKFVPPRT